MPNERNALETPSPVASETFLSDPGPPINTAIFLGKSSFVIKSSSNVAAYSLGSARVSRAGFGVSPKQSFSKSAIARCNRQHARRMRSPERPCSRRLPHDLNFRFQFNAALRLRCFLDPIDQLQHLGCGRAAIVHDKIAVHFGNTRLADARVFHT